MYNICEDRIARILKNLQQKECIIEFEFQWIIVNENCSNFKKEQKNLQNRHHIDRWEQPQGLYNVDGEFYQTTLDTIGYG